VKGDRVDVRVRHRLKGSALRRLVAALAVLPEARDLQLRAEEEHYGEPFSDRGPCSPCAVRR
jgi:hypothetical protein